MTRKDYVLIAEVFRIQFNNAQLISGESSVAAAAVLDTAHELADALHRDNPRFDREHFLAVVRGEKEINSHPARRTCTPTNSGVGR